MKTNTLGVLVFLLLLSSLATLKPTVYDAFIYKRFCVENGQVWRLVLSGFAHINFTHLLVNSIALSVIWSIGTLHTRPIFLCLKLLLCNVGTVLTLHYMDSTTKWYCGLSGALHGLWLWVMLESTSIIATQKNIAFNVAVKSLVINFLIIGLIILKIALESTTQNAVLSHNFPVLLSSHAYGAFSGMVLFFAELISKSFLSNRY